MKMAVFYYSQSGQALKAAQCITDGMRGSDVVFKTIVPVRDYPFPWGRKPFFNVFPETRLALPPSGIKPIDFTDVAEADMVMVVGQSWFLSPSLPLQSFFSDPQVRRYLRGRDIVFVNACRNMWLMTSRKVLATLQTIGARLVGEIVLQDEAANLVSAVTIVRWLLAGKKSATRLLPAAGIAGDILARASRFGPIIEQAFHEHALADLQQRLMAAGAIRYKPSVLFLEKAGHRMFGVWARFIRHKGPIDDPRRQGRLTAFYVYLVIVLFVLSPFAQLVFWITYPFRGVERQRRADCYIPIRGGSQHESR